MEFREEPFKPTTDPRTLETDKENVSDPEIARLLGALERYVNREFHERDQMSFSDELDEIEIRDALYEMRFERMGYSDEFDHNWQRKAVVDYHTRLQNLEKFANTPLQELLTQSLSRVLDYLSRVKKLLLQLEANWDNSVYAFIRRRERKEGRYINIAEEFGGSFPDVRFLFNAGSEAIEQLLQQYPELAEAYKRFRIDQYPNLQKRLQEIQHALDNRTREHPEEVRSFLAQLHGSDEQMDSVAIDHLIGIKPEQVERDVDMRKLEQQYGHEQFPYQGTPYEFIRQFLKELNLTDQDVLYDLGCGYGRVLLYGAMTTPGKYRGIEIVPERVVAANAIKDKFNLDNVDFRQGNVLEQDYTDGSVFFLFSPFTRETLEKVGEQLKQLAKTKKIRVVSLGPSTSYFNSQPWLCSVEFGSKERPWDLTIYESL